MASIKVMWSNESRIALDFHDGRFHVHQLKGTAIRTLLHPWIHLAIICPVNFRGSDDSPTIPYWAYLTPCISCTCRSQRLIAQWNFVNQDELHSMWYLMLQKNEGLHFSQWRSYKILTCFFLHENFNKSLYAIQISFHFITLMHSFESEVIMCCVYFGN